MIDGVILTAHCDQEDRLIAADVSFTALNDRAGGAIGEPLATPQLATIVRLARRLGILVARAVTIADHDVDLDCWVRATPANDGVALALSLVRERPAWRPSPSTSGAITAPLGAEWTWETDAGLRIQRLEFAAGDHHGVDASAALGQPLTKLFALDSDDRGLLPLLGAVAALDAFENQPAVLRETGTRVMLAGHVRRDQSGAFAGFVGATFHRPIAPVKEDIALRGTFNRRLDAILRGPLGRIVAHRGQHQCRRRWADRSAVRRLCGRYRQRSPSSDGVDRRSCRYRGDRARRFHRRR